MKKTITALLSLLLTFSSGHAFANDGFSYQSVGGESNAISGLTVKVNSLQLVDKPGSVQLVVNYTQTNRTPSSRIIEGSFKLFFTDGTSEPQYGAFNYLFPGDSSARSYTWEWVKGKEPWLIEWEAGFFDRTPTSAGLKWKVGPSFPAPGQVVTPPSPPISTPAPVTTPTPLPSPSTIVPDKLIPKPSSAPKFSFLWKGQNLTISVTGLAFEQDTLTVIAGGRTVLNRATRNESSFRTTRSDIRTSATIDWATQYFDGEEKLVIRYSSCAALWKSYDGGISRISNPKNKGPKVKRKPTLFAELYNTNATLDRDKDGIVCER